MERHGAGVQGGGARVPHFCRVGYRRATQSGFVIVDVRYARLDVIAELGWAGLGNI